MIIPGGRAREGRGVFVYRNAQFAVYFSVVRATRAAFRHGQARANGARADARAAAAYLRLHRLIVQGLIAPGSPLVESDLCARLGVSRTPVRAALLRLQQEGLVRDATAAGGRHAVVSPLTVADLREIFLMVGALAATAARQATDLDAADRAALAAALDEENRAFRTAFTTRPPDLVAGLRHHLRFHATCIPPGAGPRLRAELIALVPQATRYERAYSAATIYAIDQFARAHEAIVAAIAAGDADAAERAVAADWRLAADRCSETVEMLGERGSW